MRFLRFCNPRDGQLQSAGTDEFVMKTAKPFPEKFAGLKN
jgi:hypothetical protein